jgi:zinc transporter ZupT/lipoprotein-anchoring transpeptidase ErfK/SrfK
MPFAARRFAVALASVAMIISAICRSAPACAAQPPTGDVSPAAVAAAEAQAQTDFSLLPSLPPVTAGKLKTFHLIAEVKPWTVAPGIVVQAWTYNGTVPGPTIHVRAGDRVRVILTNHLSEPTTIHWHGLEVAPDMDGVPGFSQDAVQPGQTFTYEFTANDPGTYIYHTHYDDFNQLDRGLYGAVVVDEKTPQPYDRDYLMLLSSWRVFSGSENFFSINGKSYPLTKPYVVRSGDRVRIREINISGTEFHTMHIHGHKFTVVDVDGQPVPQAARQKMVTVTIGPGETRDIAFNADAQPGTWMVHCHVLDHMMNGGQGPGGLITAIQYANAPDRFSSLGPADTMVMAAGGGSEGEGTAPSGPPLGLNTTLILGTIAGLTIFFGLPFAAMKRISKRGIAFLNAIAIGVLYFLLYDILRQAGGPVFDAMHAVQLGAPNSTFAGIAAVYLSGLLVGLVGLVYLTSWLIRRAKSSGPDGGISPVALATAIAIGIGSHNFSEGLAIGQSAATGAVQLAALLIIGFGLHNMTEGFGIAAPLAGTGAANLGMLVRLGLIGGAPTFLGTLVGYHFVSPVLSVVFLTLAAGAIIYVIGEMTKVGGRVGHQELATIGIFLGFAAGFGTDLILSSAGA